MGGVYQPRTDLYSPHLGPSEKSTNGGASPNQPGNWLESEGDTKAPMWDTGAMATTPTIKRIRRLEDLVEGFDPRFGYRQFIPYWTQLPNWWQARDVQGRTPFMVGLLSTKGANPEFYLTPGTQEVLTERDTSGRNLWNYAWRTLFYGSRSPLSLIHI